MDRGGSARMAGSPDRPAQYGGGIMSEIMTKGEREDLQRLIRQREKVQKSAAKERSAQLLAEFENQMYSEYRPQDDPIWEELVRVAQREVDKLEKLVAARCRELGIPTM